jgi:hypothetical protein
MAPSSGRFSSALCLVSEVLRTYRDTIQRAGSVRMTQSGSVAIPHSITSSAATCRAIGTLRPSTLAVLRLITSRKRVGC